MSEITLQDVLEEMKAFRVEVTAALGGLSTKVDDSTAGIRTRLKANESAIKSSEFMRGLGADKIEERLDQLADRIETIVVQ